MSNGGCCNGHPGAQRKVFLWAVPRSISTAFFRAMMTSADIKVMLEPFARSYYFGSQRVSHRYKSQPINDGCTFHDIKLLCEKEAADSLAPTLFVKDMAYYLVNKLDEPTYIPEGFQHTFLIRNPRRAVTSLYKLSLNESLTGWDHFDEAEVGFKELVQMFDLVKNKLGQTPFVIDADDLLANPEKMLRAYCSKTGIKYEDSMVNWESTPPDMSVFQEWMPWFEGTLKSTAFRTTPIPPKKSDMMKGGIFALPDNVEACIANNMDYYNYLYKHRLTFDNLDSFDSVAANST
ncbi:uncharacterized protein LOC135487016 isoform X2 [Lineus longissimus]